MLLYKSNRLMSDILEIDHKLNRSKQAKIVVQIWLYFRALQKYQFILYIKRSD